MVKAKGTAVEPRVIRDKAFADRLNSACDSNSQVPAYNYGRLSWVRDHLNSDKNVKVSTETVRKWFAGEAKPRPDKLRKLAQLLQVDEAWLFLGITPEMEPDQKKDFNDSANGAVSLVAGLIQLNGGHPASANDGDPRSKGANLLAIVRGRGYGLHVALGQETDSGYRFVFPADRAGLILIGVIQTGPLRYDLIRVDEKIEKHGDNRGGFIELNVRKEGSEYMTRRDTWEKIKSFKERF